MNLWQKIKKVIGKDAGKVLEDAAESHELKKKSRDYVQSQLDPLKKEAQKGLNALHVGVLSRAKKAGLPQEVINQMDSFLVSEKSNAWKALDAKETEILEKVF